MSLRSLGKGSWWTHSSDRELPRDRSPGLTVCMSAGTWPLPTSTHGATPPTPVFCRFGTPLASLHLGLSVRPSLTCTPLGLQAGRPLTHPSCAPSPGTRLPLHRNRVGTAGTPVWGPCAGCLEATSRSSSDVPCTREECFLASEGHASPWDLCVIRRLGSQGTAIRQTSQRAHCVGKRVRRE